MLKRAGSTPIFLCLGLTVCLRCSLAMGQEVVVGGVTVEQHDDTVTVHYIVNAGHPGDLCKVDLLVSTDGGLTYSIHPQMAKGLDRMVKVGIPQQIVWLPLKENTEIDCDKVVFKVLADLLKVSDEVEFIRVLGGEYKMGDSFGSGDADELPVHYVTLSSFSLGVYEVTNRQYMKFLNDYKSDRVISGEFSGEPLIFDSEKGIHQKGTVWLLDAGFEDYPVRNVTWFGANEFCRVHGYRLPTEAEWEYAARVQGGDVRFADGKNSCDPEDMNYDASNDTVASAASDIRNRGTTTRVGVFPSNGLGLYDMSGNVWEWCQDWYDSEYYALHLSDPKPNTAGPWFGNYKVIRGGGFGNDSHGIRATDRSFKHPGASNLDIGFRAARN